MINKIFPYKLQLHIFQLDEYHVAKFLKWVVTHFFTRTIEDKKHFAATPKAKAIFVLAVFLAIIKITFLTFWLHWIGLVLGLALATQAYLFLIVSYLLLLPYLIYKRNKIKTATEKKLSAFPSLKIVGITGSYGKTSTKEFLYQILKTKHTVLRTPGSYNTLLGIAKVVDLELDGSYEYFLCEMGAYKIGEIKEICHMVYPKYGILTGINEQHIETFGSLANTTQAKFELIASLLTNGFGVVNADNDLIRNAFPKYSQHIVTYGFSDKRFSIQDIEMTHGSTHFMLILNGKKYKAIASLLGKSILQNILAAATMSYLLGMKPQDIVSAIAMLRPIPHRLEVKDAETMTIIDDAYNSNVDGFHEAISLLESYGRPKIFVTPGIVDLGDKTISIHEELGKLFNKTDYIILIGRSDRTKGLALGIRDKKKIIQLESIKHVWKKIESLGLKNPVVVLENDLPDNY